METQFGPVAPGVREKCEKIAELREWKVTEVIKNIQRSAIISAGHVAIDLDVSCDFALALLELRDHLPERGLEGVFQIVRRPS